MIEPTDGSFKALLPHFGIERPCHWEGVFKRRAPLTVEIGFGLGEILLKKAAEHPEGDFIGIENHWERICKTLRRIEKAPSGLPNVRILRLDATVAFERLFDEKTIDHIYSLFPCPWPKKKHIKHRLFSRHSLKLLNSRLKSGAQFYVVSDYYPYIEWIREESRGSGFSLEEKSARTSFDTKFEKKWRGEGQEMFFELLLTKTRHIHMPVKKDVLLKHYKIEGFDPARFKLEPKKTAATIVYKHMNYDEAKKEALIHTIVAEENLTQHFWIMVKKNDKGWIIKPMEGHYFFPTTGIAEALRAVYLSAKKT